MARVTFSRRFDYRPRPDTWITYEAGRTYDNVRRECADRAIAEGAGTEDKATRRRKPEGGLSVSGGGGGYEGAVKVGFGGAGGLAVVGERGPELLDVRRGRKARPE